MPSKKGQKPTEPDEKRALEQRVDAMLDPNRPDTPKTGSSKSGTPPPLDIFEDVPKGNSKTAPDVPDKLLKKIGAEAVEPEAPAGEDEPPAPEPEPAEVDTNNPTAETSPGDQTADLDDKATDKAVDDIAEHEADTMLAVQDAIGRQDSQPDKQPGWKDKLRRLFTSKWTWLGAAIVLAVLFAVPYTRYKLLGLCIKEAVTVSVSDSKTGTPVSNALVNIAGRTAKTDGNGKATVKTVPGHDTLTISKKYYKAYAAVLFVQLRSGNTTNVRLVATGRQVPVTVLNRITGQPLANAEIKVLKTTAKTDAHGKATIVLPATAATDNATVQLRGYNTAKATVQVTSDTVPGNTFNLTPAGHVYFLSNQNGTIDVAKANLDGTGRQTVLAGTGKEDAATTSLLASRDWRYIVLKARRNTAQPALYLIDTDSDKVTAFDTTSADLNLVGWYGHNFIYDLVSSTVGQSQTGHELIKSYDADHLQLNQLDQTQADGTPSSYAYQDFYNFYILNNLLVYNTMWASSSGFDLSGKNDTIRAVQPSGLNKKDYQVFSAAGTNYILAALYQPQAIYYDANNAGTNRPTYYNFANQTVDTVSIDQSVFTKGYPTYLVSPSGNQTLWTDSQAGKNVLFTGDANAQHAKQIASLSNYAAYGWYGENYVLLSKGNSELYIMPASGLRSGRQPLKVADYFKSIPTYRGYGYGYGGL